MFDGDGSLQENPAGKQIRDPVDLERVVGEVAPKRWPNISREDWKDRLQEAKHRTWSARERISSNPHAYFRRTLHSVCCNFLKLEKRMLALPMAGLVDSKQHRPEKQAWLREVMQQVMSADPSNKLLYTMKVLVEEGSVLAAALRLLIEEGEELTEDNIDRMCGRIRLYRMRFLAQYA